MQPPSKTQIEVGPINQNRSIRFSFHRGAFQFSKGAPEFRQSTRDLPKPKDRKFIRANNRVHARSAHLPSRRTKNFELSLRRDRAQRFDKRSGMRIARGLTGDGHYAKDLG